MSSYRFELFPENDLHDFVDLSLRLPVVDSLHDVGYIHFSIAVGIALEDDGKGRRAADGVVAARVIGDGDGGGSDSGVVLIADCVF